MNISGILVHARPTTALDVGRTIGAIPGVEVHMVTDDDRLIVTAEEPDGSVGKTILDIQQAEGVVSAALIYQQSEPDSELEETCDAVHTP